MKLRHVVVVLVLVAFVTRGWAEDRDSWSAELLNRILKAEPAKPEAPASAAPAAEMVLRTYQLRHLRVGEAGKPQNVLAILDKLLPAGSSVRPDVPANSLHVLTTATAHQAVWDYLSAVDVVETAPPVGGAVPDEVKSALQKLAQTGEQSEKLVVAVGALKSDVAAELADIDARQRQQTIRLLAGGSAVLFFVVGAVFWMMRRRGTAPTAPAPETATLAVGPDQLTTALAPVHDKMRNDMLGLLNEVAIKLQAQHNEQQKLVREQQQQLEDARLALAEERRQFITEAGSMVVKAVERVDATTVKLAKQQDKVAELVQELQNTVRELDDTKDDLRNKEIELEQERAKIAALSILLEEGGAAAIEPNGRLAAPALNGHSAGVAPNPRIQLSSSATCTNPDPVAQPPATPPAVRFQFLPPDHPES